ncbi:hypothetical protein B0H11DRAFT_2262885 [Mycena galericulata]|nr:hypothetical protein B0H11DRAFT_2262885 [Mycena galericulata]
MHARRPAPFLLQTCAPSPTRTPPPPPLLAAGLLPPARRASPPHFSAPGVVGVVLKPNAVDAGLAVETRPPRLAGRPLPHFSATVQPPDPYAAPSHFSVTRTPSPRPGRRPHPTSPQAGRLPPDRRASPPHLSAPRVVGVVLKRHRKASPATCRPPPPHFSPQRAQLPTHPTSLVTRMPSPRPARLPAPLLRARRRGRCSQTQTPSTPGSPSKGVPRDLQATQPSSWKAADTRLAVGTPPPDLHAAPRPPLLTPRARCTTSRVVGGLGAYSGLPPTPGSRSATSGAGYKRRAPGA